MNLAKFVSLYKTFLLIQKKANGGKERSADTFFAGLLGGYLVFGDRTAVNEQVRLWRLCTLFFCIYSSTLHIPTCEDRAIRSFSRCSLIHSTVRHPILAICLADQERCRQTCPAQCSLFLAIRRFVLGSSDVVVQEQERNHPARDVQFHDIFIS